MNRDDQTDPPPIPNVSAAPVSGAPSPASPISPTTLWTPAAGRRHVRFDAFYDDERGHQVSKENHPIHSYFNKFTVPRPGFTPKYETVDAATAQLIAANPLNSPQTSTVISQSVADLERNKWGSPDVFNEKRRYSIFIPNGLNAAFQQWKAGKQAKEDKPTALLSLFFGVGPESNLFGLRTFFATTQNHVLITIPGVERGWQGVTKPWGIGIDASMINDLFTSAQMLDKQGHPPNWQVQVMAGYSTGFRGLNLTIINQLVPLDNVNTAIIYDAFYAHEDWPLATSGKYRAKNTQWAIDTLLAASPNAKIVIYGVTSPGGTPRMNEDKSKGPLNTTPKGPLNAIPEANRLWLDLEFGKRPIQTELLKICLARLVQGGLNDYFLEREVPLDVLSLIQRLPGRGDFSTSAKPSFTNIYDWITVKDHANALRSFAIDHAMSLVTKHELLSGWTHPAAFELLHRIFVQELGREYLPGS